MKKFTFILAIFAWLVYADTPPPGTVKAKMFTGDGVTSLTATGTALNVNVTNSSGTETVNQGAAGMSSWPVTISNVSVPVTGTFWQTTQPVSGTLTCNAGSGTQAVSLATLPALTAGAATIGNVNINGTVPVSGTITATNSANGNTGSAVPAQATQVGGSNGGSLVALKASATGVLSVDASGATVPVSGTFWQTTQPVSGTVTANAGTGTFTVDASGHTVPVSGTFWQTTQPISAASLPLPAGAATSALQSTINTTLGSPFQAGGSIGNTSFNATQGTAANLNATVVGPSGTTLATAAGLTTINTTLGSPMQNSGGSVSISGTAAMNVSQWGGTSTALGQTTMSASVPVAIASNQSSLATTDNTLDLYTTGAGPATAVINTNLLLAVTGTTSTDLQGYRSISFQIVTAASTTAVVVDFEGSDDNVNFIAMGMYDKTTATAGPVSTFTTAASTVRYFEGPVYLRYFRVRLVSAITAGTVQAFSIARKEIYHPTQQALAAGTQIIGALSANQSTNVAQINGVAPLMGNGVTGTGSPRVTIASDTTSNTNPFLVNIGDVGGTAITLGSKVSASSFPVVIASDQAGIPVTNSSLTTLATNSATLGQKTSSGSAPVVIASDQSSIPVSTVGTQQANAPVQNVYSSTNITTSAYVQLVASTSNAINSIHIFDSSGQAMILAIGGSGSEVNQLYVPPGGDTFTFNIPAGTRISYKALSANATTGYLLMSFLK